MLLTKRERKIMSFLAEGLPPRYIAEKLNISTRTVQNHLSRIYEKNNVNASLKL